MLILLIIQALKRLQVRGIYFFCWDGVKGWGGGVTGVVEGSYPPTICQTCAASETQMLSKTDQEITLHVIHALNARVGADLIRGQCTVLQLPALHPAQLGGGGGRATRGCILVPILQYVCDVNADPCSQDTPS